MYGFASADSYGYPGGLSLAPVATVTSVALAPKTATNTINTQHCVTATVKDQHNAAVVGVRVDFTVTGVNPTTGFTNTAADGTAQFCYTGTNTGDDTITATVGSVSDTATESWTSVPPSPAHLTLIKQVVNTGGGTAQATDWTLHAIGPTSISGPGSVSADVPAGTYALSETGGPAPYTEGTWVCTDDASSGALTPDPLVLAAGQSASCSITNTFNASTNTSTTVTCSPTQTCTTAPITSSGGTVVTITGAAGSTIHAEFDPFSTGIFVPCKDQKPRDPNNILSFDSDTGTKTIQMTVSGKGPVPICWNSLTKFKQRDGHDAHFNSAQHVYYGLLPDCKGKHPVAPCVLSTVTSSPPPHHDEHHHPKPPPPPPPTTTVRILAPFGDPKLRA